jgi:hypothetical protein
VRICESFISFQLEVEVKKEDRYGSEEGSSTLRELRCIHLISGSVDVFELLVTLAL